MKRKTKIIIGLAILSMIIVGALGVLGYLKQAFAIILGLGGVSVAINDLKKKEGEIKSDWRKKDEEIKHYNYDDTYNNAVDTFKRRRKKRTK